MLTTRFAAGNDDELNIGGVQDKGKDVRGIGMLGSGCAPAGVGWLAGWEIAAMLEKAERIAKAITVGMIMALSSLFELGREPRGLLQCK